MYAEFDNYRKRTNKEKADLISNASAGIIKDLLPVLDDFERAIENNKNSDDIEAIKEGFELIYNKLVSIVQRRGLKEIKSTNETFDTEKHEAIANIPAPTEDMKGKIVDTVEKGYTLNDKVLRFSKVVVGK